MRSAYRSASLLATLVMITACSAKPYAIKSGSDIKVVTQPEQVYVVSHGWHTGFVVPGEPMRKSIPQLQQRFPNAAYIEFGWGDKGFYQADEITSGLTLQAIFWPTDSVIHAVAVPQAVKSYFKNSEIETLCLDSSSFTRLITYIENSFYRNDGGELVSLQKGIYGDSQFYQADGDYYLMNTCNKWTAKGLQSAGMDIVPMFKLTAGSVMDYLKASRLSSGEHIGFDCKQSEGSYARP